MWLVVSILFCLFSLEMDRDGMMITTYYCHFFFGWKNHQSDMMSGFVLPACNMVSFFFCMAVFWEDYRKLRCSPWMNCKWLITPC